MHIDPSKALKFSSTMDNLTEINHRCQKYLMIGFYAENLVINPPVRNFMPGGVIPALFHTTSRGIGMI